MENLENSTDCKETASPLNNSGSLLNNTDSRPDGRAMGFVLVHAGELMKKTLYLNDSCLIDSCFKYEDFLRSLKNKIM